MSVLFNFKFKVSFKDFANGGIALGHGVPQPSTSQPLGRCNLFVGLGQQLGIVAGGKA